MFRKSRARHCLEMAQMLEQLGLNTPEVLWACEKINGRRDGYILTRGVAALNLVEHVARHGCDAALIDRVAAFVARLHQMGVLHVDLKGENLLIDDQPNLSRRPGSLPHQAASWTAGASQEP